MRVYKSGEGALPPFECDVPDEVCCQVDPEIERVNVFSLKTNSSTDESYLMTVFPDERAELVASGAWIELCNPVADQTIFCTAPQPSDATYAMGPFLM